MGWKSPAASDFDHGGFQGLADDDHPQYALRSILTTLGDVVYAGVAAVWTRLAGNITTTKKFLTQTGDGVNSAAPAWNTIVDADIANAFLKDGSRAMTGALDLGTPGQVVFPVTQNPSAGVNTLDDYEEGTWTPSLEFGGGTTGITYISRSGKYVKVGKHVFVWGAFFLSSKGSSVGSAKVAGLPFAVITGNDQLGGVNLGYYVNFTGMTTPPRMYAVSNSSTFQFADFAANSFADITDTSFSNSVLAAFFGVYIAAN